MRLRIAIAAWLCAASQAAFAADASRVAVFLPADRTGRSAPVERIQTALESSLSTAGFVPLPRADLDEFFRAHRIRNMEGISEATARALVAETNVGGVLVSSVDDWESLDPPRLSLTSRWVTVDPAPLPAWMETIALHGQERPGAFGLGLVTSADVLIPRATQGIAESLAAFRGTSKRGDGGRSPRRFRPGSLVVDPNWAASAASGRAPRVAVLPFLVDAAPREAGELLASQYVRWLLATGDFEVLEPGVVREALLEARVIQEDGPSLPQVDALHALLDLDLIVSGRVTDYEAMGSAPGSPFLGFSTRAIDVRSRRTVCSSYSFGRGDDRLGLFGTSRIRSSITLTSDLVRGAVEALDDEIRTRRPREGAAPEKEHHR